LIDNISFVNLNPLNFYRDKGIANQYFEIGKKQTFISSFVP